ncbi:hypothetical protein ACFX10_029539 [Malus domestica]
MMSSCQYQKISISSATDFRSRVAVLCTTLTLQNLEASMLSRLLRITCSSIREENIYRDFCCWFFAIRYKQLCSVGMIRWATHSRQCNCIHLDIILNSSRQWEQIEKEKKKRAKLVLSLSFTELHQSEGSTLISLIQLHRKPDGY